MARSQAVLRGVILLALLAALLPSDGAAQGTPFCPPGQAPTFVFGFAALKEVVGEPMGEPLECEHANPGNGDALQRTTTGLAFYRKATNTPTFTDGFRHWALTADGLVTWEGESIDPPGVALAAPTPTCLALGDSLVTGEGASDPARTAYAPLFLAHLRERGLATHLVNRGRYGETTATFVRDGERTAAELIADPTLDVRMVTLHVGVNDLLRLLTTPPCVLAPTSTACRSAARSTLTQIDGNYAAIVAAVRAHLNARSPLARLVLLTYYNPFSGTANPNEGFVDEALLGADRAVDCAANAADPARVGLNDVIICRGRSMGGAVVDLYPEFAGRALALTHVAANDIHPNDAGYAVIAEALRRAVGD